MSKSGVTAKDEVLSRHWLGLNTHRVTQWLPGIVSSIMLALAMYLLHRGLQGVQWSDVKSHLSTLGLVHVALAFSLTILSYLLLTMCDWLALRHVKIDLPWSRMAPTAFSAFAIGHNVGLAALSGGAIRYRAYTAAGIDATRITCIVLFCSATFFLGASLLSGIALMFEPDRLLTSLPLPSVIVRPIGLVSLLAPLLYVGWTLRPSAAFKLGGWRIELPSVRMLFNRRTTQQGRMQGRLKCIVNCFTSP